MGEEEKKAIEIIKSYIVEVVGMPKNNLFSEGGTQTYNEAVEKVLNLIEKQEQTSHYIQSQLDIANAKIIEQEKRNKKLRNKNQELLQKLRNRVKQVEKLERYSLYKKEFSNLNKRIAELEEINAEHQKINGELRKEIDRLKSIDIYKLVEDAETGQLIHKDKIIERLDYYRSLRHTERARFLQ